MPNLITHTLFAQEAAEKLDPALLAGRTHLYGVGANGPDFLFFQGLDPKNFYHKAPLRKFGGKFHHSHVNDFYASAISSIRNEKDPEIKADMIAYVLGHLSHWALDSTCHPYIFGRTGAYELDSSTRHHTLESLLDAAMLKVKKGQTIKEFYYPAIADCSKEEARAVARIYIPAIEQIFDTKIAPHLIWQSLNDWGRGQRWFYDYTGNKRKNLRAIEKGLFCENIVSGMIIPEVADDNWDICNLKHKEWVHPCDASIVSTESLFDLYDKALLKAQTAMKLFLEALDGPDKESAFYEFLGDRGYDTNMNTDLPMKNFDIIDFKY